MKTCAERLAVTQKALEARKRELEALRAELVGTRSLLASAERRVVDLGVRNEKLEQLRREVALVPDIMAIAEAFPDVFAALLKFQEEHNASH